MTIDRRSAGLLALMAPFAVATAAWAGPQDDVALAKSLDAFRAAQFTADKSAFDKLCAPELSYSHSDGRVEDKALFITNATAGKSKFLALDYREPKIRIVGDTAIVRFNWVAEQEAVADGKKTRTNLHILMTWIKQGAEWKLLSRGSTKL